MRFAKGTSISFIDRFNEYKSETKALGIFFKVVYRVGKSEMTLGGKNGQKDFLGFFVVFGFSTQTFPKERKWEQVDSWRASNKCDKAKVAR